MEDRMDATTTATDAGGTTSTPPIGWREMKAGELAELCRAEGLAVSGKRAELVKRLDLHYHGSSKKHVNGKVLCPYCGEAALVIGSRWMSDSLLRRTYRCRGKRRHSFTLDEAVASSQ